LRLGNIFERYLKDEISSQEAFKRLRTQFRYSDAARQLDAKVAALNPAPPSLAKIEPLSSEEASTCTIQNIRHLSNEDSSRVVIELDSNATYVKEKLGNPERIYFDIAKAKLGPDLKAQSIVIGDEFLKQIRISVKGPDVIRIVLDLAEKSDYAISELRDPSRIVIDFVQYGKLNATWKTQAMVAKSQPIQAHPKLAEKSEAIREGQPPRTVSAPPIKSLAESSSTKSVDPKAKEPPRAITEIPSTYPTTADRLRSSAGLKDQLGEDSTLSIPTKVDRSQPVLDAKAQLPQPQPAAKIPSAIPSSTTAQPPAESATGKPKETSKTDTAPLPSLPKPSLPTSQGDRTLTRSLGLKIGRIAIDPGHGGQDLGTIGPGGLYEKDLVLSIARDLRELLIRRMGAEVILTRDDDYFLSLEERTAIANQFQADLFISIHANSSQTRSTAGVETYYLDFAKTDAAREIAARENATTARSMHELEDLIKKIAQADKSAESRELATLIQKNLYAGSKKIIPSTQNRGVRSAPFIVLIGANMPSILAEVAFISNPKVEKLLKKELNQAHLVKAIFTGIEDYMKTLGSELVQHRIPVK
jgi:N-acetylmuramoyl-L-alanine amidase